MDNFFNGQNALIPFGADKDDRPAISGISVITENGLADIEPDSKLIDIAEEAFSFDGYQVVRREFFAHKYDPALTIRGNSIVFNSACISKLENVVYVQVLINPQQEKLVIRPCDEEAKDSLRWCIAKSEKRKSRQITCGLFTAKLYNLMGWETQYRYKLLGTKKHIDGEEIYIFDLTATEVYLPNAKDDTDGEKKTKRNKPFFPEDWRDSFGIPVREHRAATEVDLLDYGVIDVNAKNENFEGETIDDK